LLDVVQPVSYVKNPVFSSSGSGETELEHQKSFASQLDINKMGKSIPNMHITI